MSGIMDKLFGGKKPAAAPAPQAAAPATSKPAEPKSEVDWMANLWNNTGSQKGSSPLTGITREQIKQVADQADFTTGVDPTLLSAALKGDEAALRTALNGASRAGFTEALLASSKLTEATVKKQMEDFQAQLPGQFRNFASAEQLAADSKFADPTFKPMITAIQQQIAESDPHISAAEVAQRTQVYMQELAKRMTPQAAVPAEPAQGSKGSTDFSFLMEGQ
jgi:hypothetical protein